MIRKTCGVVSSGSGSVGTDDVRPCAVSSDGDKGYIPVVYATESSVGDVPDVRRRGK